MTFLQYIKKRAKAKDILAERAGEILALGKPGKRGAGLPEWQTFVRENGGSVGAVRAVRRLFQEFEAAA